MLRITDEHHHTTMAELDVRGRSICENLAMAIVKQAVSDWRDLLDKRAWKGGENSQKNFTELEDFFTDGILNYVRPSTADKIWERMKDERDGKAHNTGKHKPSITNIKRRDV